MKERKRRPWLRNRDVTPGFLRCRICGEEKPPDKFYRDKHSRTGHCTYCRDCRNVALTPEQKKAAQRKHRLSKLFGLTLEEYEAKLAAQNGVCAICCQPETGTSGMHRTPRRMAVDHNHTTGQVRDLLCHLCNSALGSFMESPELLKNAITYLEKWREA